MSEILFVAFGFVESTDGFIDFLSTHRAAGFDPVGGRQFVASGCLGREELAEENMAVCEGFFDDKSVRRVVVEGIANGSCFSCALCCMIVACCLYYFA